MADVPVTEAMWKYLIHSPYLGPPALDSARTFVAPLLSAMRAAGPTTRTATAGCPATPPAGGRLPSRKGLHLMSTLLLGRWDDSGNLVITSSHQIEDGDQAAIDALVRAQDARTAWACEFDVDHHGDAVQRAYEEYVRDDDDADLIDDVQGFEPTTD